MKRFQNLHLADRSLFTQYKTLFKTDISGAHAILENTQLETKLLRASEFNDITSDISTIENYYYDNVPKKLYNLLQEITEEAQDVKYIEEYSAENTYKLNNLVSLNNELYYCKVETSQGVAPTDTNNWVYLGLRGEQGAPSLGLILRGVYSDSEAYNEKDVVAYNNDLWVAKKANSGKTPSDTSTYWSSLCDVKRRKININDANLTVGDILWKEI